MFLKQRHRDQKKTRLEKVSGEPLVIALAGNPNTGKSTIFNALTGLNQHTGNWPGKTVLKSEGHYVFRGRRFVLVDLPGTYSLQPVSPEEQVARDFICFSRPQATVVVADATCLERNLNLVLQVMEISSRLVVSVNLIDEAIRKRIRVDVPALSRELGVPVVATAASSRKGLAELKEAVYQVSTGAVNTSPRRVTYDDEVEETLARLEPRLRPIIPEWVSPRWVALRLLEGERMPVEIFTSYIGSGLKGDRQ